jgi:hypothetical protein
MREEVNQMTGRPMIPMIVVAIVLFASSVPLAATALGNPSAGNAQTRQAHFCPPLC